MRGPLVGWCAGLALLGGCLLPSFEKVSGDDRSEGGASSGGAPPTDAAGMAGDGPLAGEPAGGAAGAPARVPRAVDDQYVLVQGSRLEVAAEAGVLANDTPAGALRVQEFSHTDPARPPAFDATLQIAPDGSLSFEPAAAYFGNYRAAYTASAPDGSTLSAEVTFVVQPSVVALSTVADGIGGVVLSGTPGDAIGAALAPLGDVNGDGFADFAVGAPAASAGQGSVYVVFGSADFGSLSAAVLGPASPERLALRLSGSVAVPIGMHVAAAGRFDADAFDDIAIGSPDSDSGRLFVVRGGKALGPSIALDALTPQSGVTLSGIDARSQLGLHVSAGDFDGDGKQDLVSGFHPSGLTKGGLCLVSGASGVGGTLDQVTHGVLPDQGVYDLPQALTFVGDVSGDGRDDVLASSKRHVALLFGQADLQSLPADISQTASSKRGLLRVRESGVSSMAAVAAAGDVNADGRADFAFCDQVSGKPVCSVFFGPCSLSTSLATPDWQLAGLPSATSLPLLAAGSDLNHDGMSDLLLATSDVAYVVFGRSSGLSAVDLGRLGDGGFSLELGAAGALSAAATVGDVNGDGYGDFALGDDSAEGGAGRIYVVFGGPYAESQR